MTKLIICLTAVFMLACVANGETIGTPDNPCLRGSCNGVVFTLEYAGLASPNAYRITYTMDVSNFAARADGKAYNTENTFLKAIGFKVVGSGIADPIVSTTPETSPPSIGDWEAETSTVSANGCNGGGTGWVCAQWYPASSLFGPLSHLTPANIAKFAFDITIPAGTPLLLGPKQAGIKALFVNSSGAKVGSVVSEPITLTPGSHTDNVVPEPATVVLLSGVLLSLAFRAGWPRRKYPKRQTGAPECQTADVNGKKIF